jgi:hypothetical protein
MLLAAFTLAAWAGWAVLWRRRNAGYLLVGVIWLTYPLTYYLIQWSSRYRLPIDWSLILCAGVAMHTACKALRRTEPV